MISAAKAIALSRDLADKLSQRFAGASGLNSVRQAFDASGWPMIFVSNASSGEGEGNAVVLIRIKGVDMVSKDVFGNSSSAYAPHTLEFAYELAASNKPIPTLAQLAACEFEAIKTGVRYQLKEIANGTAVSEAAINAKSPDADLEELYWPTKSV